MNTSKYCKLEITLIIPLLYILPVILTIMGIIPYNYRFIVLTISTIAVILYTKSNEVKLEELYCTSKNLLPAMRDILPGTLGFATLMSFYYFLEGARVDNSAIPWYFYLFFIFISAPFQEFLYRGYLFHVFSKAGLSQYFLVVSSCLYSFVHAIYWDLITLLLTLIIGFFWGYHYNRFRNLYSVILSHILLGLIAISTGLL